MKRKHIGRLVPDTDFGPYSCLLKGIPDIEWDPDTDFGLYSCLLKGIPDIEWDIEPTRQVFTYRSQPKTVNKRETTEEVLENKTVNGYSSQSAQSIGQKSDAIFADKANEIVSTQNTSTNELAQSTQMDTIISEKESDATLPIAPIKCETNDPAFEKQPTIEDSQPLNTTLDKEITTGFNDNPNEVISTQDASDRELTQSTDESAINADNKMDVTVPEEPKVMPDIETVSDFDDVSVNEDIDGPF